MFCYPNSSPKIEMISFGFLEVWIFQSFVEARNIEKLRGGAPCLFHAPRYLSGSCFFCSKMQKESYLIGPYRRIARMGIVIYIYISIFIFIFIDTIAVKIYNI